MKLKVGDRIRRNGSNVTSWAPLGYETVATKGLTYTDVDGDEEVSINPDDWDLISEGPVRTITRREVVEGVYGRIKVVHSYGSKLAIAITGPTLDHEVTAWSLTSAELKAAAAVLLELAGALDSE